MPRCRSLSCRVDHWSGSSVCITGHMLPNFPWMPNHSNATRRSLTCPHLIFPSHLPFLQHSGIRMPVLGQLDPRLSCSCLSRLGLPIISQYLPFTCTVEIGNHNFTFTHPRFSLDRVPGGDAGPRRRMAFARGSLQIMYQILTLHDSTTAF